jgi:hypothetical protein
VLGHQTVEFHHSGILVILSALSRCGGVLGDEQTIENDQPGILVDCRRERKRRYKNMIQLTSYTPPAPVFASD